MLDAADTRVSRPTPPAAPAPVGRPQEAIRTTVEQARTPSSTGATTGTIQQTVARRDLSAAEQDRYMKGVIDAAVGAPDQATREALVQSLDDIGRGDAAPAVRDSISRLVAAREIGPKELSALVDPDVAGDAAGTRSLLTGIRDGAVLNRVANDTLTDANAKCWADQSAYAGAMTSAADIANMAAAKGAPGSAKAVAQAIVDAPRPTSDASLLDTMTEVAGPAGRDGMTALTGLLGSAIGNPAATDALFTQLSATREGDAARGFHPDAGNDALLSRMDAYFAQGAERLGDSGWVNRNEVDQAVQIAKAGFNLGGSGLADVLQNPNLNEAERNLVVQELARDPDARMAFYANDAFRTRTEDAGALASDQRVIADAVQTAYAAGALTSGDLTAIADMNEVGNGGQRFMEVLNTSTSARMPGGAVESLADALWARDSGTDRAVAGMAYTSSPQMMAENLTTPAMRAEAFQAIVEFTDAKPWGSAPDSVAEGWERSAIAASGRLFTAHATEITDAFTASQVGQAPQTETMAKFFSQTAFNPEASTIALDNRRDLQPAVRQAMTGVQQAMFTRAEAAPAGSIERARAFEVLGQFSASISGGAAVALNGYTKDVENAQEQREAVAGLVGAAVGDLVGARLPVGNTVGNLAETITQDILDAVAQNPDRPDQALAGVLSDQFSTAVDAERVKLNDNGAMAAFDGAFAKELLNLQNNLNVNLGAHAD